MSPLICLLVLIGPQAAKPQQRAVDPVSLLPKVDWREDKKVIRSENGAYALTVSPRHHYASGETSYALTTRGRTIWSATKPYFLYDVAVGNQGTVIGTSYTRGVHGWGGKNSPNDLDVWFLDAAGKEKKIDSWPRSFPGVLHAPDSPTCSGIAAIAVADRVCVEISGRGQGGWNSVVRNYVFSTGDKAEQWASENAKPTGEWFQISRQSVVGAPLLAVSWRGGFQDLTLMLVDVNGKPVWSKKFEKGAPMEENYYYRGDFLPCPKPLHFAARIAKMRAEFEVRKVDGKWQAVELDRKPFDPGAIIAAAWKRVPIAPQPKLQETISFRGLNVAQPAIHGVRNFVFAGPNRFAYVENWPYAEGFAVWIDDKSQILSKVDLKALKLPEYTTIGKYAWLGNGRMIILGGSLPKTYKDTSCLLVDFKKKTVKPASLKGLEAPSVAEIAVFPSGKIVASSSYGDKLLAFDKNFRPLGEFDLAITENKNYQVRASGMAIDAKGNLLTIDSVSQKIGVFNESGKCLRVLDVKKTFGESSYVPDIAADANGGFVVYDSDPSDSPKRPTMFRFDANGKLVSSIRPRFRSGKLIHGISPMQVDDKGRIWIADEVSLNELDSSGVVKRTLGAAPSVGILTDWGDWKIGSDGSHYILDSRTLCLFAFRPDGQLKYRFQPTIEQLQPSHMDNSVVPMRDGSVRIWASDRGIRVSSTGKYGGKAKRTDAVYFPDTPERQDGLRWSEGYQPPLRLVDGNGKAVMSIRFRPDGGLLGINSGVVAAGDGSVCTVTTPVTSGHGGPMREPAYVSTFGPKGEPLSCFEIPLYWPDGMLAAFDGKKIFFETGEEIYASDLKGKILWRLPRTFFPKEKALDTQISFDCKTYLVADTKGVRSYTLPK